MTLLQMKQRQNLCRRSLSVNNLGCICRYDNRDQLPKEPACSGFGNVRIVTVEEEQKVPGDYTLTRTDDTLAIL